MTHEIKPLKDRFQDSFTVCPDTGCWLWTGATEKKDGYGRIAIRKGRRDYRSHRAHRVAWQLFVSEEIPPLLRHKCDNRLCVNPEHLEAGTQQENIQDAVDRDRHVKGEVHGMHKLTAAKVLAIRASNKSNRDLATAYDVSYYTIWDIKKKRSWTHL